MQLRALGLAGAMVVAGVSWTSAASPFFGRNLSMRNSSMPIGFPVPFEELSAYQQEVRQVLQGPTVAARAPAETFACRPENYYHFLDHPDQAVRAWRKLGAKCVTITDRGAGQFGWNDELGSEVTWETVFRGPNLRIWYAHGKVRPSAMFPMVPVQVVVVLHHAEKKSAEGDNAIEHHSEVFLHTDSKTAALFARMMGSSSARLAEQGLSQMQLFFSALCWYLDQHPQRAAMLMGRSP